MAALSGAAVVATAPDASAQAQPPPIARIDTFTDVQYGEANGKRLLLDAYVPEVIGETGRRPAVLLIHGGGFRVGDKSSFAPEARKLAAKGWVAFSVNYRLDEPSIWPAEVDDVRAAVRWVRANADRYNVDPRRVGALGESAGGTLAALLGTLGQGARDTGERITVGVSWSGPMDLAALARERGDGWGVPLMGCSLAECPDRFEQMSPITHINGSDSPLFLVNSTDERVPRSQTLAMGSLMEDRGQPLQLRLFEGDRHALDYREDVWVSTEVWLEKHLTPSGQTSPGTAAFAGTVLVMLAFCGGAVLYRRRRQARAGDPAGPPAGAPAGQPLTRR